MQMRILSCNKPLVTSSSPSASISVVRAGARAACLAPSRPFSKLSRALLVPTTLFLRLLLMLLLPPKLFLLIKLARRLGILVPIGLYSLTKLFLLHAAAKLNASSFSLCSFFTGARYLARGIGSPGLYTFEGQRSRSFPDSFVEELREDDDGEAFRRAFFRRSRRAMLQDRFDVVRGVGCGQYAGLRGCYVPLTWQNMSSLE